MHTKLNLGAIGIIRQKKIDRFALLLSVSSLCQLHQPAKSTHLRFNTFVLLYFNLQLYFGPNWDTSMSSKKTSLKNCYVIILLFTIYIYCYIVISRTKLGTFLFSKKILHFLLRKKLQPSLYLYSAPNQGHLYFLIQNILKFVIQFKIRCGRPR